MTNTEQMTNRDLDAAVAELIHGKVEGWQIHDDTPYSTSLDAALRAYEEFRKRGWVFYGLNHCGEWTCELARNSDALMVRETAPTPARALCLALLSAAGRE